MTTRPIRGGTDWTALYSARQFIGAAPSTKSKPREPGQWDKVRRLAAHLIGAGSASRRNEPRLLDRVEVDVDAILWHDGRMRILLDPAPTRPTLVRVYRPLYFLFGRGKHRKLWQGWQT